MAVSVSTPVSSVPERDVDRDPMFELAPLPRAPAPSESRRYAKSRPGHGASRPSASRDHEAGDDADFHLDASHSTPSQWPAEGDSLFGDLSISSDHLVDLIYGQPPVRDDKGRSVADTRVPEAIVTHGDADTCALRAPEKRAASSPPSRPPGAEHGAASSSRKRPRADGAPPAPSERRAEGGPEFTYNTPGPPQQQSANEDDGRATTTTGAMSGQARGGGGTGETAAPLADATTTAEDRRKKRPLQLDVDVMQFATLEAWDRRPNRPDWMRHGSFAPCTCKECYFCLTRLHTHTVHPAKK